MRPIALGRKNYLFMGSERGGKSAAIAYTLIETAKLSGVDPQAWLTDVLSRIADHKIKARRTHALALRSDRNRRIRLPAQVKQEGVCFQTPFVPPPD